MRMQLILEFREVFNEEPKELSDYLDGISRSTVLQIGTHFLSAYNNPSQLGDSKSFLETFFRRENLEFANDVYQKTRRLEQEYGVVQIVSIHSSLRLFEYSYEHLDENEIQTGVKAEVNIFKAYLLLNQQYTQKEGLTDRLTKGSTKILEWAEEFVTHEFAYSELINFSKSILISTQIIKAIYLFEFLENNSQYHTLLNKFVITFDCSDWKDYLKKFISIIALILNKDRSGHLTLNISKNDNYVRNCAFLEQLTLNQDTNASDIDFRHLRSNPLYKRGEGEYQIIFDKFVFEKIFKGLYFHLNQINSTLHSDKIQNLRSFWGNEYSEKVLLYSILEKTYEDRYIKFSGEQIRVTGIIAEPDYYIRNGNKIFLFESKDIMIKAEVKTSFDFQKIENELKRKLYFDQVEGKVKNKAVLQLINNVKRVLTKSFPFDDRYRENSVRIYPILVLHDHQFNLAGLNILINNWFQTELKTLCKNGLNISKVRPLTIIDIDTLIFHQDRFRVRQTSLDTLIESYHKCTTFNPKKTNSSIEKKREYLLGVLHPFSTYLSEFYYNRGVRRPPPKILSEKGFSLFK